MARCICWSYEYPWSWTNFCVEQSSEVSSLKSFLFSLVQYIVGVNASCPWPKTTFTPKPWIQPRAFVPNSKLDDQITQPWQPGENNQNQAHANMRDMNSGCSILYRRERGGKNVQLLRTWLGTSENGQASSVKALDLIGLGTRKDQR